MIVVSNTTPLNYLILIDKVSVLAALFKRVITPEAVARELSRAGAPVKVRNWIASPPDWLSISSPQGPPKVSDLDEGERDAITLACELHADRILLDESKARKEARRLGLKVAGTLAVLIEAADLGLLDLNDALDALRRTNFYVDEKIIQAIRDRRSS